MGRKYAIAIQAEGEHASEASPRISAVVQVDEDGTTQLIEMTVGTVDGGPIRAGAARTIDFQMLAEALGGVVSAAFALPADDVPVHAPTVREPSMVPMPSGEPKERPYRRMPGATEVVAIIHETGSVGKVAQHFRVPRYTAQAWVNRLRRTGQLQDVDTARASA